MVVVPRKIEIFRAMFDTDEACLQLLHSLGWKRPDCCIQCESQSTYLLKKRSLVRCRDCGYEASVTAGTALHGTHLSLTQWFLAFFQASKEPGPIKPTMFISIGAVGRYATAWELVTRIRTIMRLAESAHLSGSVRARMECIIMDEICSKSKNGQEGDYVTVAGVETFVKATPGPLGSLETPYVRRARLAVVPSREPEHMMGLLQKCVESGSTIELDKQFAPKEGGGYKFILRENTERSDYSDDSSWLKVNKWILNGIREVFSGAIDWSKEAKPKAKYEKLEEYLDEYVFRHNQGFNPELAFSKLITTAMKQTSNPVDSK